MRRGAARWRPTPNLTPTLTPTPTLTLTLTLAITLALALTLTLNPLTLTLTPGAARRGLRAAARLATAGGQRNAPG